MRLVRYLMASRTLIAMGLVAMAPLFYSIATALGPQMASSRPDGQPSVNAEHDATNSATHGRPDREMPAELKHSPTGGHPGGD